MMIGVGHTYYRKGRYVEIRKIILCYLIITVFCDDLQYTGAIYPLKIRRLGGGDIAKVKKTQQIYDKLYYNLEGCVSLGNTEGKISKLLPALKPREENFKSPSVRSWTFGEQEVFCIYKCS